MRVIQATFGTFHHFDLARELESLGQLACIYSTYPMRRLQREGVSPHLIRTFPWVQTSQIVVGRYLPLPVRLANWIGYANALSFDRWLTRNLRPCDAYVAITGCAVSSGKRAKELGARYICDRGSSHMRYQDGILSEEFRRWGVEVWPSQPDKIERAEIEYAQADVITVPSEFVRRSFIEMGVPEDKLRKIPYGVRLERFQKTAKPPRDSFDVLFAGTVSLRKGIPYLLEAFQRFRHSRKRLRIAGPVDLNMQSIFARFDMTGVEVLGRQPQAKLAELMSSSHVMVLPSIEEGLALVQGQALACGCPLISSLHSGGEDLFTDGVEGFLVPIRSPEAILDRLSQLADDPDLRNRMSEAAQQRVKSLGGWKHYGQSFSTMLQELTRK
jgi:glycosyltransferase involved in cell wall biosynthesis